MKFGLMRKVKIMIEIEDTITIKIDDISDSMCDELIHIAIAKAARPRISIGQPTKLEELDLIELQQQEVQQLYSLLERKNDLLTFDVDQKKEKSPTQGDTILHGPQGKGKQADSNCEHHPISSFFNMHCQHCGHLLRATVGSDDKIRFYIDERDPHNKLSKKPVKCQHKVDPKSSNRCLYCGDVCMDEAPQ